MTREPSTPGDLDTLADSAARMRDGTIDLIAAAVAGGDRELAGALDAVAIQAGTLAGNYRALAATLREAKSPAMQGGPRP